MKPVIVIFAADRIRGGITRKILQNNGLEPLLYHSLPQARAAIAKRSPAVLILDTKNALADEISAMHTACSTSPQGTVLVLGAQTIVDTFQSTAAASLQRLVDPLDPELIVERVKTCLQHSGTLKDSETDQLENDLRQFLGLE